MITESKAPKEYVSYKNYKTISFYDLTTGHTSNENYFLNNDGFTFIDYVGCLNLSGNELYCYPALAKALRNVTEYPLIKRSYKINSTLQGKHFIKYFYKMYHRCYFEFQQTLANANSQVNNIIYLYGDDFQVPIITGVEEREVFRGKIIEYLIINGVRWYVNANRSHQYTKQTERLDLHALLAIDHGYILNVETALINTPFLGIRFRKEYKQKGHIVWYNLETREQVAKKDIEKWKKQHNV